MEKQPITNEAEKPKHSNKVKVVAALVAVLAVLGLSSTFLRDTLYTGSDIQKSDLVQESSEGISFKRPSQWQLSSDPSVDIVYTEDGKNLEEADQGLLLSSEDLGVDFSTLDETQKTSFTENLQSQFSDESSLEGSGCTEISNLSTNSVEQPGYDTAFLVEAECSQFTGRNVEATLKMLFAVSGEDLHIAAVLAINQTWDKSGDALDTVIASVTPAE